MQCTLPCLVRRYQILSSNLSSPDGSAPDLERMGGRSGTLDDKVNEILLQLAQQPSRTRSVSRFESCVQTLSQSRATITTKVTSIEQVVGGLASRVATSEAGAISASSVSGSPAGSWSLPGQIDGSTATRSRVPSSLDENRNTRRRLDKDTSPDDENARGVLLGFPCKQCLPGMYAWLKKHSIQPTSRKESTAKEESNQLESCLIVKILWQDSRMMSNSPFGIATSAILVGQSRAPEWRVIGRRFAPLLKAFGCKITRKFP